MAMDDQDNGDTRAMDDQADGDASPICFAPQLLKFFQLLWLVVSILTLLEYLFSKHTFLLDSILIEIITCPYYFSYASVPCIKTNPRKSNPNTSKT
jgi:hypothetical protein